MILSPSQQRAILKICKDNNTDLEKIRLAKRNGRRTSKAYFEIIDFLDRLLWTPAEIADFLYRDRMTVKHHLEVGR